MQDVAILLLCCLVGIIYHYTLLNASMHCKIKIILIFGIFFWKEKFQLIM